MRKLGEQEAYSILDQAIMAHAFEYMDSDCIPGELAYRFGKLQVVDTLVKLDNYSQLGDAVILRYVLMFYDKAFIIKALDELELEFIDVRKD